MRPLIALNPGLVTEGDKTYIRINHSYLEMVRDAGGAPVVMMPDPELVSSYIASVDAVILTGGPDIDVRPFGGELHPAAETMDPRRQAFDFALLAELDRAPSMPVLGICLGMQEMGMHGGCPLIQHMADVMEGAHSHGADREHEVTGEFGGGVVTSHHHQALENPGKFNVIGSSTDGVIEGIRDPERPFYVGVQWHPERTRDRTLGLGVIERLVEAARRARGEE